jgi:hypothetical protein
MNRYTQARFSRYISHILYLVAICAAIYLASFTVHAQEAPTALASKTISLENRYPVESVSEVFKENILLTLAYMAGRQDKTQPVNWAEVKKPFTYDFSLKPGEVFAFHDTAYLPSYAANVTKTTNAHYNGSEGFKSDGYLMGDGVCHLASLFYWAAKDAGMEALAPVNHDFAAIPQIDKQYGVAIYADPNNASVSMQQNLYIKNTQSTPLIFRVVYNGIDLTVEILKQT